jgi:hypothetical protein
LVAAVAALAISERLFAVLAIEVLTFTDVIVGSRPFPRVPLAIFEAFVVSVVALGARPVTWLAAG